MKVLGLDLGTNSVGWAYVEREPDQKPTTLAFGSYVFPEAGELEHGLFESHRRKTGVRRRQRRNLRRKRQRRDELVRLLTTHKMLPQDVRERTDFLCRHKDENGNEAHPYALRKRGLDDPLTLFEFGRCLYHIMRRRGYLSTALLKMKGSGLDEHELNKEDEEASNADTPTDGLSTAEKEAKKQEGVMLSRIRELRERLDGGEARTLGEFLADRLAQRQPVRGYNKTVKDETGKKLISKNPGRDPLGWRADRLMFEDEFNKLWDAQARFHKELTPHLKRIFQRAIFDQRQLRNQKFLVGNCEFFSKRKRADRASLIAQRSVVLQHLSTISVVKGPDKRRLTGEEVLKLANKLELVDALSWEEAGEMLGIPPKSFSDNPETDEGKKKSKAKRGRAIRGNLTAAAMRKAIGDKWSNLGSERQEDLVTRLITYHTFESILPGLKKDFGFDLHELYNLATIELPEGYANHCSRVLKALEPHLQSGKNYYESCLEAGYRAPNESTVAAVTDPVDRLPYITNLRNPMVERSVNAAVRVINCAIARYGKPDKIRIELPRDVSRTNKQREELWKDQDARAKERDKARKTLEGLDRYNAVKDDPRRVEGLIKKVRLWQEAGCRCPYEPEKSVSIEDLLANYDIDHIVPRSRCYENGWHNLTICPRGLNERKNNATPFEIWGGDTTTWANITTSVNLMRKMSKSKRDRILCADWSATDFNARALTETSYISKEIATAVRQLGVVVESSRGQITSTLRSMWGVEGILPQTPEEREAEEKWHDSKVKKAVKPRFDHRHHALDAVVIALTDVSTLQKLTAYFKKREESRKYEDDKQRERVLLPKPWEGFTEQMRTMIEFAPVVFQATRTISGALHQETARKPPSVGAVMSAIKALPQSQRDRIRDCVVVGTQLVALNEGGKPLKAYDLGSNHHCVIWESKLARERFTSLNVDVVTMIEASRRAQAGEAVFQMLETQTRRAVMSLCQNDVVAIDTDSPLLGTVKKKGKQVDERDLVARHGNLWRVAKFSPTAKSVYMELAAITEARANELERIRIQSNQRLSLIIRRVAFDPCGFETSSEPAVKDD